jgi:hypothetical protein
MIDPCCWGDTHAAEILAEQLNSLGNKRLIRRIGAFLDHTFVGFKQLGAIEDEAIFQQMVDLWRKDRISKVNFRDDLNSLIKSTITSAARHWLRSSQEESRYKGSK